MISNDTQSSEEDSISLTDDLCCSVKEIKIFFNLVILFKLKL